MQKYIEKKTHTYTDQAKNKQTTTISCIVLRDVPDSYQKDI